MAMSDKTWNAYIEAWQKQIEEENEKFYNHVPGWYNGLYYDMLGDKFVPVESINGDNTLNYPD
jgi:hypothetical protein